MRMLIFKKILPTILFYIVSLGVLYLAGKASPGGPCVPGLGMLLGFFIFFPLCLLLFAWNFYLTVKNGKVNLLSTVIHGLVIATLCVGAAIG